MPSAVIWIGPLDGAGYPVELRAPAGLSGRLPATALDPVRALDVSTEGTSKPTLDQAGLALFDALQTALGPDFGPRLLAADDIALDVRAPELVRLPWELLRLRPNQRMVFADPARPAVRGHLPFREAPAGVPTPVHVLVVVGDPDDDRINTHDEVDAIYAGVCDLPACWQVDVLAGPSVDALRDAVADIAPHVLHFIGHGTDDGGPALGVVNAVEGPWTLTADFVVNALNDAPPPRLVVLNACRTAPGTGSADAGRDAAWGVAEAFLNNGSGAVVSMQGDVASPAAVVFSRHLYESLVGGDPLPVAVARARNRMAYTQRLQPRDWVLPVLTARAEPAGVLTVVREVEPHEALRREPSAFDNVRWMVDRSAERRRLVRWLDSCGGDGAAAVIAVKGEEDVGKSWVARACVLVSRMRGIPVAYVDLEHQGRLDWVAFMTALVDAAVTGTGPAAEGPAARFREHLGRVTAEMNAGLPGRPAVSTITESVVPPRLNGPLRPEDYFRSAFEGFDEFVDRIVVGRPLLVVIDHVDRLQDRLPIVRWLVTPAARAVVPRVRIAVVGQESQLGEVLPGNVVDRSHDQVVDEFSPEDIVRLAREYCVRIQRREEYRTAADDEAVWRDFVESILGWATGRAGGGVQVRPGDLLLAEKLNDFKVRRR